VDKLTKSIFEDLAAEESNHHKNVRFQIDYWSQSVFCNLLILIVCCNW
jgi:hypothetical protein